MGYGYGVWLVVKDSKIQKIVDQHNRKPHVAHITVMCNMSDTDAFKLSKQLKDKYNVTLLNRHVNLNGTGHNYSEDDNNELYASGYYCVVDGWREITEKAKFYRGSIPMRPHLSIAYRAVEKDLPKNATGEIIKTQGYVGTMNINSIDPSEWYYINQTNKNN